MQPARTTVWINGLTQGVQDQYIYASKLLTTGLAIASLVPSSRATARGMLQGLDFSKAKTIVELGAGTGPVTGELLRACAQGCRCLIVERDPDFCELLRARFPKAEIIEGDALALDQILDDHGVGQIDHILSELPLGWLPLTHRDVFLNAVCRRLTAGGTFRQLTHMPGFNLNLYQQYFRRIRTTFIPWNLPPAACYVCDQPRGG